MAYLTSAVLPCSTMLTKWDANPASSSFFTIFGTDINTVAPLVAAITSSTLVDVNREAIVVYSLSRWTSKGLPSVNNNICLQKLALITSNTKLLVYCMVILVFYSFLSFIIFFPLCEKIETKMLLNRWLKFHGNKYVSTNKKLISNRLSRH